jgi:predicted ATPase
VTYLLQAGERAQKVSAHHEAIRHLSQGLAQLAGLPASLQRARQELALQIALGNTLVAINGYAFAETGEAYKRAYALALHAGETPQIFAALQGLHAHHSSRGESQSARAEAEQMLHLAQNQPDPVLRVSAHSALAETLYYLGEFASAREHLEQAILFYHPQNHLAHVLLFGQDEGVVCQARLAHVLWLLGYPDQALQRGQEALALAQELAHSFSLVIAFNFNIHLHLCRQEEQVAQRQAEALIKLSTEQGLTITSAYGTFHQRLALVRQGDMEGIDQMQRGLRAWQVTGAELLTSYFLAGLAEAYAKVGQTEQGLILLTEALAMVDKTDDRFWEAELYRLRGELLLLHNRGRDRAPTAQFAEVEACFRQAIDVARRQQAKSLELRATTSLYRLWQAQGKGAEAHALLAEIYGWFTEGFDTADLIEAKVLLEALT